MRAVLFDLDDTLYPEIEFVKSGFRAVAGYLSSNMVLDEDTLFEKMLEIFHRDGRGSVFDELLRELDLYTKERVMLLVYQYRSHIPTINLFEDVLSTIANLRERDLQLGVITDGMASVQRRKFKVLGLGDLFDVVIYSDEIGKDFWKPSIVPYKVALDLLMVETKKAVYVGNDLSKDYLGANTLGMLTIHVDRTRKHGWQQSRNDDLSTPRFVVNRLSETLNILGEERYE